MKIMHSNFVKSQERDVKYKNRNKNDVNNDEDFAQYVEEQHNTRKMSNIL